MRLRLTFVHWALAGSLVFASLSPNVSAREESAELTCLPPGLGPDAQECGRERGNGLGGKEEQQLAVIGSYLQ